MVETGAAPVVNKYDYVRHAQRTRQHYCHWPGCGHFVPPAMWGCKAHWYRLPGEIRDRIWRAYRIGQELPGHGPSPEYVAANAALDWIAEEQRRQQAQLPLL